MRLSNPDRHFDRYRRTGDPAALARVFDRLAPELLAVARHLVPDAAEAEDVVQATFLAAIEGAPRFDPTRSVRPWLMGILSRQAGLARRRLGRAPEPDRLVERNPDDPALQAQRAELRTAVEQALRDLPAPYTEVLTLHLAEERRPEEIARHLGRSPGTVRVQLHRGLKLLRRLLPAGITAGWTTSMRAPRGLGAIKAEVLAHAGAVSTAAGAAPLIGVLAMAKAGIFGAAAVAAVAGVTYLAWPGGDGSASRESARVARPPAATPRRAAALPGEPGPDPPAVSEAPAPGREPVRAGSPEAPGDAPPTGASAAAAAREHVVTGAVVDSESGEPVPGAEVRLWLESVGVPGAPVVTQTGQAGEFEVPGVPGVPAVLRVAAEGYAPLFVQRPFGATEDAGERETLDAGAVAIERGVHVTGRVVEARSRSGIGGAEVFGFMALREGVERRKTGYGWRLATADDAGRFELRDRLRYTGSYPTEHGLLAASPEGLGWITFEALAGAAESRDVAIEIEPGVELDVLVVGDGGRPVPDARVVVDPLFDPFTYLHRFEAAYWTGSGESTQTLFAGTTDERGRLTLEHLPLPRGAETARVGIEYSHGGPARFAELVLDPLAPNAVTLSLEEVPRTLSGRVSDDLGRPLAGATLSIDDRPLAATGADGAYELALDEQEVRDAVLVARAEGHGRGERAFDPSATFPIRGVDFVLPPAAPIRGVVVDPEGQVVARTHVSISSRGERGTFGGSSFWVLTDEEGRFAFEEATAGAWLLHVTPPYDQPGWVGVESTVVEGGGEDVVVTLRRAEPGRARVVAEVFEAHTGLPVDPELVYVTVRAEPGELASFPVHKDVERVAGGVVLEHVREGAWRLWVRGAEGLPGHADFDVAPGVAELHLRVEVGGAARLRGRVDGLDASSPYTGSVSVQLAQGHGTPTVGPWKSGADMFGRAKPGPDGSFEIADLLPGRYVVRYLGPGIVACAEVDARPGEETRVDLVALPAATVHLRGPEPAEQGFILLTLESADREWNAPLNFAQRKDGTFASTFWVPRGTWTWNASFRPDGAAPGTPPRTASGRVRVAPGDVREVWVRLPD